MNVEVTTHVKINIKPYQRKIKTFHTHKAAIPTFKTQKQITSARIFLKLTTCRNRVPNSNARNLSTLIAVKVSKVTPNKTTPIGKLRPSMGRHKDLDSTATAVNRMATKGCNINPTHRSLAAKLHNKTFEGGWREDGFWRAIRIRELPAEAIKERRKLKAERNTTAGFLFGVVEQINSSKVLSPSVKFDIFFPHIAPSLWILPKAVRIESVKHPAVSFRRSLCL